MNIYFAPPQQRTQRRLEAHDYDLTREKLTALESIGRMNDLPALERSLERIERKLGDGDYALGFLRASERANWNDENSKQKAAQGKVIQNYSTAV